MARDPHYTPASSHENIYIDEYARKLVEMKRIPWHMPEYTIADVLGFESVRSLRLWVGSLKRKSLDVWQFNAYEDKYFEKSDARYWIIGGTAKPTPMLEYPCSLPYIAYAVKNFCAWQLNFLISTERSRHRCFLESLLSGP